MEIQACSWCGEKDCGCGEDDPVCVWCGSQDVSEVEDFVTCRDHRYLALHMVYQRGETL